MAGFSVIYQTEVDFGSTPTTQKLFTVTDARATSANAPSGDFFNPNILIMAQVCYVAPTGKSVDEIQNDCGMVVNAGFNVDTSLYFLVTSLNGPVIGKFKINYLIGYSTI